MKRFLARVWSYVRKRLPWLKARQVHVYMETDMGSGIYRYIGPRSPQGAERFKYQMARHGQYVLRRPKRVGDIIQLDAPPTEE